MAGVGDRRQDRLEIGISRFPDFAALEAEWRALETRAAPSFFQSWSWIGCLAEERFPDPVLLRARAGGETVGLALFNRRGRTLSLTESGDPALDAPFIEHNAPLVAGGPEIAAALLRAAWQVPKVSRLVLGGVAPALAEAAGGHGFRRQLRGAPFVDLAAVQGQGGDYLSSRSPNTRQQIRRSLRHFAAAGALSLARAGTAAEAAAWLDALVALHTASWQRRGKPGAFATEFLRRFHAALVASSFARDELDLLRLTAGSAVVGYLYNFRLGGRVYAYQSGFDTTDAASQARPGLCLHALAIQQALDRGDGVYDFLAGDVRYKQSLATGSQDLAWVELARPGFFGWGLAQGRGLARRLLRRG